MANLTSFTRLLKKAIESQDGVTTPQLRQRIYERAQDTVEKKLSAINISMEYADLQRQIMKKSIIEVEEYYQNKNNNEKKSEQKKKLSSESKSLPKLSSFRTNLFFPKQEEKLISERKISTKRTGYNPPDSFLKNKTKEESSGVFYDVLSLAPYQQQITSSLFSYVNVNKKDHPDKTQIPLSSHLIKFKFQQKFLHHSSKKDPFFKERRDEIISSYAAEKWNNKDYWEKKGRAFYGINLFFQAALAVLYKMREEIEKRNKFIIVFVVIFCSSALFALFWFFFINYKGEMSNDISTKEDTSLKIFSEESILKITKRLLPDGQEINTEPWITKEGKKIVNPFSIFPTEKALFFEEKTSALPATIEIGTVIWSSFAEKVRDREEQMVICGDVSFPGKDMKLRMTIRRNMDSTIPASYLIELLFFVPQNFYGGAIEKVTQLVFKASEQSIGQNLYGVVPVHLDENFFVLAMNTTGLQLNRNLDIMKQLPWIKLTIAYKNGRTGEFSFEKGKTGDIIFKQVLDNKEYQSVKKGISDETGQAIQEIIQKEIDM